MALGPIRAVVPLPAGSLPPTPFQLSGSHQSGNVVRGSISGGSGAGNPPGSNGPKRRFSADLQDLFDEFSLRSPQTPSPALRKALNSIVETAGVMRESDPCDPIVSDMLQKSAALLHRATAEEVSLFPHDERVMVAAACRSVGEMIIMNKKEDRECVTTLFRAASDFCSYVDHDLSSQNGEVLFLQDYNLSCMLMSLMGWFKKDGLNQEQGEPLAAVLVRIAVLSANYYWPAAGYEIPNLAGALCHYYEGIDPAIVPDIDLLRPSSYFGSAMKWRPKPLGQIDYILSTLLDRSTKEAAILSKSLAEQVHHLAISHLKIKIAEALNEEEKNQELLWSTLMEEAAKAAKGAVFPIMPPEIDQSEKPNPSLFDDLIQTVSFFTDEKTDQPVLLSVR